MASLRSLSATIFSNIRRCASRKKSARVDHLGGLIERLVVDEDRAKHALLGFEIVRKGARGSGEVRQRRSWK